jgi:hypothetical protein
MCSTVGTAQKKRKDKSAALKPGTFCRTNSRMRLSGMSVCDPKADISRVTYIAFLRRNVISAAASKSREHLL